MSHRDLNTEELAKLETWRGLGAYVLDHYALSGTAITPQLLDKVHAAWRNAQSARIAPTDFAYAFGTLIGDYVCARLDIEWAIVSDEHGQDFCIRSRHGMEAYPVVYVWKRVKPDSGQDDPDMFVGFWDMMADEVPARA